MTFASLYQKYRPGTFAEVIGEDHVTVTLTNAVENDQVFHAYLFSGPRGTGKTSTARILAKALNCEKGPTVTPCGQCRPCVEIANGTFADVFEIDAATHSKVEEAREFLAGVPTGLTAGARRKFYIVDEVHMLSTHAFNALLKTLEEPPPHVVFVLATTEPHKVPATVAGRCQSLEFRLVSPELLARHYQEICEKEGVEADPAAVEMVARQAAGSVRDGLSLLDQLITGSAGRLTVAEVTRLTTRSDAQAAAAIYDAIAGGDPAQCFSLVDDLIEEGRDVRNFAGELAEYARAMLMVSVAPGAPGLVDLDQTARARVEAQADLVGTGAILRYIDLLGGVLTEASQGGDPRLALEAALVKMARSDLDISVSSLAERVDRLERRVFATPDRSGEGSSRRKSLPKSEAAEAPPRGGQREPGRPVENPPGASSSSPARPGGRPGGSRPPGDRGEKTDSRSTSEVEITPDYQGEGTPHADILRLWPEVLRGLKDRRKHRVAALLTDGRPVGVEGSTVVIGFGPAHKWHADHLRAETDLINEIITELAGCPMEVEVRLLAEPRAGSVETDPETPFEPSSTRSGGDSEVGAVRTDPDASGQSPDEGRTSDTSNMAVVDLVRQEFAAEVVEEYRAE